MRLGGSIMKPYSNPAEWLTHVKRLNYSSVIFPVDSSAPMSVIDDYLKCCKENDLIIGEVGIWRNLMASDPAEREAVIEYSIRQLELAEYVGANCAVNISGSASTYWDGYHPNNYSEDTKKLIVEQSKRIIDAVKPVKTTYALEPMPWMLPDSVESYLELIGLINRDAFSVHLDFTNMINSIQRYHNSDAFIDDCFNRLGKYIRSVHIKDCLLKEGALPLVIEETAVGRGNLNLTKVLQRIEELGADTTSFVEHLDTDELYDYSVRYLRQISSEAGVVIK